MKALLLSIVAATAISANAGSSETFTGSGGEYSPDGQLLTTYKISDLKQRLGIP